MNPRAFKLFALLLLSAILGAPVALAQAAPKAVTKAPGTAGNNRITEDLTFGTGRTILGEAGSTFNWLGVLQGTPTGGTLNLSNLTLTLPGTYLTTAQVNGYFADPSTNGSFSAATWRADLGLVIGTNVQAYDAALAALSAGSDFVQFTGPASTIKTFTLPNSSATILTDAAVVTGAQGGTGVANTGKTITLGGNLTTSGAFPLTLTLGASTNVTLPASGTLATLAGTETLTNKKLGSLTTNGFVKTSSGDGTLSVDTTGYTSKDATFLGATGNVGGDSATNTAALWSNLPVGYSRLMMSTIGTGGGLPSASNFYFHKLANRDAFGGWAGLALRLDTTGGWFVGLQADNATLPVWDRLWGATYLNALVGTGLVKSTAGVPSAAVAGTDYLAPNPNIGTATGTSLALSGTTASTSTTTGALTVSGGAGFGGSGYFGGSTVRLVPASGTGGIMGIDASGTATPIIRVNGDSGNERILGFYSAGTIRWHIKTSSGAESTGDAGSALIVSAWNDAGTAIDNPIVITRAAGGTMSLSRPVSVTAASGTSPVLNVAASGVADPNLYITGDAGQTRRLHFRTGNSNRWLIGANNGAESGSNAGSSLVIAAYDDTGTNIDTPLTLTRAAGGSFSLSRPFRVTDTTSSGSYTTGSGVFSGGLGVAGNIYSNGLGQFAAGITNAPASGTVSSIFSTATGAANSQFVIARDAGAYGKLSYRTGTSARWEWRTNTTAEAGSNAGSDYEVIAFADDGSTSLGTVLSITRAAGGSFTVSRPISGTDTTDSTSTTTGALKTAGGLGVAKALSVGGKLANYNGSATAGLGTSVVRGANRVTAQTAANASVATYTVGAADASFQVSANVLVTTSTTHSFTVTCTYTDEGNTARTVTLNFSNPSGTISPTIANAGGAVPYMSLPLHIRAKAATAITIATTGTFTTVTYNAEGVIQQIN